MANSTKENLIFYAYHTNRPNKAEKTGGRAAHGLRLPQGGRLAGGETPPLQKHLACPFGRGRRPDDPSLRPLTYASLREGGAIFTRKWRREPAGSEAQKIEQPYSCFAWFYIAIPKDKGKSIEFVFKNMFFFYPPILPDGSFHRYRGPPPSRREA